MSWGKRNLGSLFKHSKSKEWPPEFICPISKSPMADPVIVCSGQSYERRCIEAWMKAGQRYCHVSGIDLLNSTVITNVALKNAISHWCQAAGLPRPSPPDPGTAKNLVLKLVNQEKGLNSTNGYSSVSPNSHSNSGFSQSRALSNVNSPTPTSEFDSKLLQKCMSNVSLESSSTPNERNRVALSDDLRKLDPFPNLGRHYHSATQVGKVGRGLGSASFSSSSSGDITVPLPLATTPLSYSSQTQKTEDLNESQCVSPPEIVSELAAKLNTARALDQEEAAIDLRNHTRKNSEFRISLCHPKLLSALLLLLTSRYQGVQTNAVAALVNLSLEKENKVAIVRAGAIPYLIDVLKGGYPEAQEHAAGGIFSLSLNDENKIAIGVLGAILPLIHILRAGEERAKQDAAMALYHLSFAPSNKSRLVKVGAVPFLMALAQEQTSILCSRALMILCNIAASAEGRKALVDANAIAKLVGILGKHQNDITRGGQEIQEQTVSVLLLLSQNNLRFVSLAMQAGAMDMLVWLSKNGNERAKEKASVLLSMMREVSSSEEECLDSVLPKYQTRRLGRAGLFGPNSTNF